MSPDPDSAALLVVHAFIQALNNRHLDEAGACLSDDVELVFPGNNVFRSLGDLSDWSKTRYRSVTTSYDRFDEIRHGARTVVYASGTIEGELLDGSMFTAVRCLDRFEIQDGRIVRKEAWSDMADFLRKRAAAGS